MSERIVASYEIETAYPIGVGGPAYFSQARDGSRG